MNRDSPLTSAIGVIMQIVVVMMMVMMMRVI